MDLESIALSFHTFTKEYWTEGKDRFDVAMTWNRDEHRNLVYSSQAVEVEIKNLHLSDRQASICFMTLMTWKP